MTECEERYVRLWAAVTALYFSAHWSPDRPVDEEALWSTVRDAAGIPAGMTNLILGERRNKSNPGG